MQLDLSKVIYYNRKALERERGDSRHKFATGTWFFGNLEVGEGSVANWTGGRPYLGVRVRQSVPAFL